MITYLTNNSLGLGTIGTIILAKDCKISGSEITLHNRVISSSPLIAKRKKASIIY